MKRRLSVFGTIGLLAVSTSMMFSSVQEPICMVPCKPPIYDASLYPEGCYCMFDGSEELLGVTSDGCYVIRYKGKIYIVQPKNVN